MKYDIKDPFDIEAMYQQYLKMVNLNESGMHEAQKFTMRDTFFGCAGMMLISYREHIAELPEDVAVNTMIDLERQVNEYFQWRKTQVSE